MRNEASVNTVMRTEPSELNFDPHTTITHAAQILLIPRYPKKNASPYSGSPIDSAYTAIPLIPAIKAAASAIALKRLARNSSRAMTTYPVVLQTDETTVDPHRLQPAPIVETAMG